MSLLGVDVSVGQRVLLLWGGMVPPESMKDTVQVLTDATGNSGKVQVEHIERLALGSFS